MRPVLGIAGLLGVVGRFIAQTAGDIPEPWNFLLNYGVLAAVFILIVSGRFIVTRRELDDMRAQRDKAEAEKQEALTRERDLYRQVVGDVVPQLSAVAQQVATTAVPPKTSVDQLAEQVATLAKLMHEKGELA